MLFDQLGFPCLIAKNLVFVPNWKCASTFFLSNLQRQGWQTISYGDIDWCQHHVWSHIMDPVERRIRGQIEFLAMQDLVKDFLHSPKIQLVVLRSLWIDMHALPYSVCFGDHRDSIDWIPLHQDHSVTIERTTRLLEWAGVTVPDWEASYQHPCSELEQQARDKLRQLVHEEQHCRYIDAECDWITLYNDIKDPGWPECPPRRDFDRLPEHVQQELKQHAAVLRMLESNDAAAQDRHNRNNEHVHSVLTLQDQKLYNAVMTNFDWHKNTWPEITWLRHRARFST